MKTVLIKTFVICLTAMICGTVAGVLFSLFYYGFIPEDILAEVYLADTYAKMKFRFWIAFAAGAIFGAVWSYKIFKPIEFK